MTKKRVQSAAMIFLLIAFMPLRSRGLENHTNIKRLTFSGNNEVQYPCLSDDGGLMIYVLEIREGNTTTKSIKVMDLATGNEEELFRDGKNLAPDPFGNVPLVVGTKPPLLCGNGKIAIFSLSLGEPELILDHYLAVAKTDGTEFHAISFPMSALRGKNIKSLGFNSSEWERVSNYAVSADGRRIACLVKGHLGPRRYGNPSGVIFLDDVNTNQRTILAPDLDGNKWEWSTIPRRPLTGGGWAFAMSGNGQKLVFGAQSSDDTNDYDLYSTDWEGKEIKRITDFQDRWFSLADISHDGEKIAFYYTGKKKQGIGTYIMTSKETGLNFIKSNISPRVEFIDMSGDSRYLLFKHIYTGMMLNLQTGQERVILDENISGYVSGLMPMDFPRTPAFWRPKIISFKGDKALITGSPRDKQAPEFYILNIEQE